MAVNDLCEYRVYGKTMPVVLQTHIYNFVADSFHIKKLCSRLSSSEVRFYPGNGGCAFWVVLHQPFFSENKAK